MAHNLQKRLSHLAPGEVLHAAAGRTALTAFFRDQLFLHLGTNPLRAAEGLRHRPNQTVAGILRALCLRALVNAASMRARAVQRRRPCSWLVAQAPAANTSTRVPSFRFFLFLFWRGAARNTRPPIWKHLLGNTMPRGCRAEQRVPPPTTKEIMGKSSWNDVQFDNYLWVVLP